MASGKSLELISRLAPLKFSKLKYKFYQPTTNVRDEGIWSRNGLSLPATKINSLRELEFGYDVIGIDEINLFEPDTTILEYLLKNGTSVVASGLLTDYRGQLCPTTKRLLELGPDMVIMKTAICSKCHEGGAQFTQVYGKDGHVLPDLGTSIIPDDGTFHYEPVCRKCFVK